ncbi:MAG: enoyl-ACP reductase FabI [Parvibaculales bacterium]
MQGKRGLIMGVANKNSIAWGIAQACADAGAELAFTYQGEMLLKRVAPLAESVSSDFVEPCDVTDEASMDALFEKLETKWGKLDFVVHAIAFAGKEELMGRYVDTSSEAFDKALNISCYSFTAVAQRAEKLMEEGGSMITLSYYGAAKVIPHYNVMGVAKAALEASVRYLASDLGPKGIRVNSISAGPIRTLAAAGIGDFREMLKWNEANAPMRRNVTKEQVGQSAVYLLSDMSAGVSGEIHYVDVGYNTIGMAAFDDLKAAQSEDG